MSDNIQIAGLSAKLNSIESSISSLETKTNNMSITVYQMSEKVGGLQSELEKLRQDFNAMVEDQRKTMNLQRAISELVRVRQEISQKYGNYTVIRQTMLGVLQATDLALVKKTTISKVSEELMLSTPNYWLAPCLVAVSAWISNDRELADRAIREAMKRDEEKTALAMALICRRNGRVQTGYEWLSIYFARQSAINFTEESFTYIDAYVNGIFGPDERHTCQGYVSKWIDEVRGNKSNFETSQVEIWKQYCARYSRDVSVEYADLSGTVPEYNRISKAVGRIRGLDDIKRDFRGIQEAFVDQESMKKAVDAELIRLIGNYDVSEMDIRREEEYLSLVKYFKGDEEKAREEMNAREARRLQHKLDFIEQMSNEITSGRETTPSKKKTAVTFLSSYINQGVREYIAEPKADFPSEVTINIDKWSGKSKTGEEAGQLTADFEQTMNEAREQEIQYAATTKPKRMKNAGLILLALTLAIGIGAAVSGMQGLLFVAGLSLIGAVGCFSGRVRAEKQIENNIRKINEEYDEKIRTGKIKIQDVLREWKDALHTVNDFDELANTRVVA